MLASLGRFEAAGTQLYRELFGFSNALGTSPLALPAAKCVIGSDYYIEFYVTLALPWLLGALAVVIKLVSLLRHAHVGMRLICSQVQTNKSHARRFAWSHSSQPSLSRLTNQQPQVWSFFRERSYMSTVSFVFFISYNALSTQVLSMLDCTSQPVDGQFYLEDDLAIPCAGARYTAGVIVACLGGLLYALGIPALLAAKMYANRDMISQDLYDEDADAFFSKCKNKTPCWCL